MSARGMEFLEDWVHKNITEADRRGKRESLKELADRCVSEAAVLEIALDDIGPEWGNVEAIIKEAIEHLDEPGTPGD